MYKEYAKIYIYVPQYLVDSKIIPPTFCIYILVSKKVRRRHFILNLDFVHWKYMERKKFDYNGDCVL